MICFLKRYYLFKKETAIGDDETKPSDPFDIEFTFTETISSLRQNFKFIKRFTDSVEAVNKMEDEIRENLLQTAPGILMEINENSSYDQLDAIKEVIRNIY